jgi:hypothetical protein
MTQPSKNILTANTRLSVRLDRHLKEVSRQSTAGSAEGSRSTVGDGVNADILSAIYRDK